MTYNFRSKPVVGAIALAVLLAGIFIVDTVTDLEIAAAVFYIAATLIAIGFLPRRGVMVLAGACISLTLISFILSPTGMRETGLINCGISIAAIAITAYLALKLVAAEAAAHEARAQLVRIARIKSLGELTASIAHEVNQPLAAVMTSGNACLRWLDQDPPNLDKARRAVDRIISDAGRAGEVIARVRGLAKGEAPHKSRFNLNEAIVEVVALSTSEIDRNGISLAVNLKDDLPAVLGDRVQIQQVIGNLILNAVESLSVVPDKRRLLEVSSSLENHGMIVFSVADSGSGLAPTAVEHVFDAFWTTKESGTGLGLTICRSIIEAHDGRIWATQRPGRGALFQFSLPAAEGEAQ